MYSAVQKDVTINAIGQDYRVINGGELSLFPCGIEVGHDFNRNLPHL